MSPWVQRSDAEATCTPCFVDDKNYSGISPGNFDLTISPRDNFFLYSNKGWMTANPIPGEYSSWNTFVQLRDLNFERIRTILDELSALPGVPGTEAAKVSDFYRLALDEDGAEDVQLAALDAPLSLASPSAVKADVSASVAGLHSKFGVRVLFSLYSSPDKKNANHSLCTVSQSGLGLPDKDYYFDADKSDKRAKYKHYVSGLFQLLGVLGAGSPAAAVSAAAGLYATESACDEAADMVIDIETKLAKAHLTRTESRDPIRTYNKMSVDSLVALCASSLPPPAPGAGKPFDWPAYFSAAGKCPELMGDVNVSTVEAAKAAAEVASDPESAAAALPHYLTFHILNSSAPHLSRSFVDLHFAFHEKELKGTAELRPRWKRALEALEDALGEALSQLYVNKFFAGDAKPRALRIVEQVRDALRERLQEVEWMSPLSKIEALKKMEAFKVKIGFPDKFIDYSALVVSGAPGQLLPNVFAGRAFSFALDLARMNAPTDRGRWFMTCQTINAYYHPSLNEVVFPAAILQGAFFDANADDAVNFGSMGAVVGHEMTHGFDDQGRKYDSEGTMRDWWAPGDGEEYERRVKVMIDQAEAFEVHGVRLKGQLTCGENVADLGGLKLALRALNKHLASLPQPPPLINGFTPHQRFFLAWSQCWRENVKKERALQLVTLDPHGPNELRCNQPLSNMEEFCAAFGVVEGDKMWKHVENRVDIW